MNANFLNIHDAVLALTFVECLFLAALFKTLPSSRYQTRQLLVIFFLSVAVWIAATLLIWNHELQTLLINKTAISPLLLSLSVLIQGPCLYLYLRSFSEKLDYRDRFLYLHIVPAVLVALVIITYQIDGQAWVLQTSLQGKQKIATTFAWSFVRCIPLLYAFACFYVVHQLRSSIKQTQSSPFNSSFELKLTYVVLLGFFIHWLWAFIQYFAGGYLSHATNDWVGDAEDFLIVLQVNGLLIIGLKSTRELLTLSQVGTVKVIKQSINVDNAKIMLIDKAVKEQKLFLENNINLDRFSELIGLKSHDVSKIINSHYQLNFFDFMNNLRLEEAKKILASPEYYSLTISEIIYKSGFNSQSAFQRFFKRYVGCTPTEYRRKSLSI